MERAINLRVTLMVIALGCSARAEKASPRTDEDRTRIAAMLAELRQPLPVSPKYDGPPFQSEWYASPFQTQLARWPGYAAYRKKMEARRQAIDRRSELVSALAATDDAGAATLLAAIPFERRSPDGYGWNDWNPWGRFNGWLGAGAPLASRGGASVVYQQEDSQIDFAHSPCLAAAVGYPITHAPIYRMLARVGRRSDLDVLDRFDHLASGSDGWSRICAADDADKVKPGPRTINSGFGLCRGWDVGQYRVVQANDVWLRRKVTGGSFGPPAWAAVGVDTFLQRHPVSNVEMRGPAILVTFEGLAQPTTIDPSRVFLDRDGDGVSDRTEHFLGTDPERKDSDGDGKHDGVDGSPLASPARTESDRVAAEAIRYVARFVTGGLLTVLADAPFQMEPGHLQGVILHRARGSSSLPPGERLCKASAVVEALDIKGDSASVDVSWTSGEYRDGKQRLQLRRAGPTWRVVGDVAKNN
jgi:hypothetical protein